MPSQEQAFEIADNGFNINFARKGLFGSGFYFTDQFCKAAFYVNQEALKKDARAAVVLVCRVSMGHPFLVPPGQMEEREARRPPRKCGCATGCQCGVYYDSVVAHTNVLNGGVEHGIHREIVVYDTDLVYPEFLLILGPGPEPAAGLSAAAQALAALPREPASAENFAEKVKAIISEMSHRKNSEEAQEKGCSALLFLAILGSKSDRAMIGTLGGIEAVIAVMTNRGRSAGVQKQGCRALCSLADDVNNCVKIGAEGGIKAAITAMMQHDASAGVQKQGCGALCNLAVNDDNRAKIGAEGGIEVVIAGMTNHSASVEIQEEGCGALHQLASNDDNRVKIEVTGGIEAVIAAMSNHGSSVGVQEEGCGALCNLAVNDDNRVKIGAEGGIEVVTVAIQTHRWSASRFGVLQSLGPNLLRRLKP